MQPKLTDSIRTGFFRKLLSTCLAGLLLAPAVAQENNRRGRDRANRPPTLGLDSGFLEFDTPDFKLKLVKDSQTIAALEPKSAPGFDFTPADRLEMRAGDGFNHLGDITFRVRAAGAKDWQSFSTAAARHPVAAISVAPPLLASADLTPTLPSDCPIQVTRTWLMDGDHLALRFELKNTSDAPLAIGGLGLPVVFNNIITGRSLEQAHEICSFADPYVGMDAGYLQVTRLSGHGPALVVVPLGETPFEAYQLLLEPMRPSQTFEGTFEWIVHSWAYAETEWTNAHPWNVPSMETLAPGDTLTCGLKLLVADQIRHIERTLSANGCPVAVGIPGYIVPQDLDARLFLDYSSKVKSIRVEPKGALKWKRQAGTEGGWQSYAIKGVKWGRARLTVNYADGTLQTVQYYVTKPAQEAVKDLGHFLFTRQWFDVANDPFGRSPSVMSYDREKDAIVEQDSRVWIAGLGDEGGSGSWLAAGMKLFGQPEKDEVRKYEDFVDKVLWGGLQFDDGPNKYGVRKSLFYYSSNGIPGYTYDTNLNWRSWTSWSEEATKDIGRGYNYPHVVAAYWSLYRLGRNQPGLVTHHDWEWYLNQAYETTMLMTSRNAEGHPRVWYVDKGLMDGTVFLMLLEDLKREGWGEKAAALEARMKAREELWSQEAYPFGSEMAWDSTGQEEVYGWCKYFGRDDKALVSLNSILGYMPTVPHWGYNGNARRYWDFLYGGKLSRIERQLHHYGSGLNAIPPLTEYREHPDDFYLLRIGYGGAMGALSSIDQGGFASAAFHSFPSTLKWDAYSGDYGPNFFGHAVNTATYVIDHPEFGWQAFGGNLKSSRSRIEVEPRDSFRTRVYLAPLGLWLTLDAGQFKRVEFDLKTKAVRLELEPGTSFVKEARLCLAQPARLDGVGTYAAPDAYAVSHGAVSIPLKSRTTRVELTPKP